jgi:hypothetical protein
MKKTQKKPQQRLHRQINEQNWLDAIGDLAKTGLKMAAGTDRPPAKNPNEVQAAFSKDFSDNLTTELNAAIRAGVVDPNLQTQATATGASSQAPAQATGQGNVAQTPAAQQLAQQRQAKQQAAMAKATANPVTPATPTSSSTSTPPPGSGGSASAGTISERQYQKLNSLFETYLNEQDRKLSIAEFLTKQWYPRYMRGTRWTKYRGQVAKLANAIQAAGLDKATASISQLGDLSYIIQSYAMRERDKQRTNRSQYGYPSNQRNRTAPRRRATTAPGATPAAPGATPAAPGATPAATPAAPGATPSAAKPRVTIETQKQFLQLVDQIKQLQSTSPEMFNQLMGMFKK